MAQFAFSLNTTLDGTVQTALVRYNVDDSLIPAFLDWCRNMFDNPGRPGMGQQPPAAPLTDVQLYKQWARSTMSQVTGQSRALAEQKAAQQAVQNLPPPIPPVEQ